MKFKKHGIWFNNRLPYNLLMIPIFEPDFFKSFLVVDNLFIALKFIALIIIGSKYISLKKVGKFTYCIGLYCLTIIFITFLNGESIFYVIKKTIECVLISMFLEVAIFYNARETLKWTFNYLFTLCVLNFILVILFPNGLIEELADSTNYKMHFLCIKNGMINWFILTGLIGLIYIRISSSKKVFYKFNIFLILGLLTILLTGSSTGIILFLLFFIYCMVSRVYQLNLSIRKIFPTLICLFLAIIIFRVQEYFSDIFSVLFNKDSTFSGRSNLWDSAIYYFLQSPWWGNGLRENSLINYYGRSYMAHNFILEILMDGGLLLFTVVILMIIVMVRKFSTCKDKEIKNNLTITFILIFIASLVETNIYNYLSFAILPLIYSAPLFEQEFNIYNGKVSSVIINKTDKHKNGT